MEQRMEKKVYDLEICKNIQLLKQAGKIIIYGAAEKGRDILEWLEDAGIHADCFCDRDIHKWGGQIAGVEIISPFALKDMEIREDFPVYIIACIERPNELVSILGRMKKSGIRVITYWGIKMALYVNAENIFEQGSKRMALLSMEKEQKERMFFYKRWNSLYNFLKSLDNMLWVVQPGKTASISLETRLKEKKIPYIETHYLEYPAHAIGEKYRAIWEDCIKRRKEKALKVIVAVREPLARDYSAFWQAFSEGVDRAMLMPILDKDLRKMYDSFIDMILKGRAYTKDKLGSLMPSTWNDELEWFDEQIKRYLDIDVFAHPFDREKGYVTIKKGNIQLLVFKVEKLNHILDVISAFVGAKELPDTNANTADKKWYGMAYAQLREEIKLPYEYVAHYYHDNPKMDYFYTAEEKAAFLDKWSGNIDEPCGQ